MSKYILTKRIPSCNIDSSILKELQAYIIKKAESFYPSTKNLEKEYLVRIIESEGAHEYVGSINFDKPYFSNNTRSIKVYFEKYSPSLFRVELNFAKNAYMAEVEIAIDNDSPYDLAMGIYSGISDIIKSYKNNNFIFHLYASNIFGQLFYFIILGFSLPSLFVLFFYMGRGTTATPLAIVSKCFLAFGVFYYSSLFIFKPYIVFKTKLNEKLSLWYNWFCLGVLGILVFEIVLPYLGKVFVK